MKKLGGVGRWDRRFFGVTIKSLDPDDIIAQVTRTVADSTASVAVLTYIPTRSPTVSRARR